MDLLELLVQFHRNQLARRAQVRLVDLQVVIVVIVIKRFLGRRFTGHRSQAFDYGYSVPVNTASPNRSSQQ